MEAKIKWLSSVPNNQKKLPAPFWIAEELTARLYAKGEARIGVNDLKDVLLGCGKEGGRDASMAPRSLTEEEADKIVSDFLSFSGSPTATDVNFKLFLLQFTRMELFKAIRYLQALNPLSCPAPQIWNVLPTAVGKYQGEKMAKHLAPQGSGTVSLQALSAFYFKYEAVLAKDGVVGGSLSTVDISKELVLAAEEGAAAQLQLLLGSPLADPNAKDAFGRPLLQIAIESESEGCWRVLLGAKADANFRDNGGQTPLHSAVVDTNTSLLQDLVTAGVDLNSMNSNNQTALMVAAENGAESQASILIKAGADATLKNDEGQTALEIADENSEDDIVRMLGGNPDEEEAAK
jgi:hypothetical protein